MSLRFAESGGQYHQSNVAGPGIWATVSATQILGSLSARNGSPWGYNFTGGGASLATPPLSATKAGLIAGCAFFIPSVGANILIGFFLAGGAQCDLRMDSTGHLFFTRNGTTIGSTSAGTVTAGIWNYIEFKALFSTTGTGTCEAYVNGGLFVTSGSLTNATTTAAADQVKFTGVAGINLMDFYLLDTVSGTDTTYLGDITVAEIYPNAAGVNSAWTVAQAAFVLTSVANASGGTTVYTGTITNGASPANAWQGFYFSITGFLTGANNGGPWLCTASTATTITLQNPSGVSETHAGTCSFQNPLQAGIHGGINDGFAATLVGTRPPADNQYIADSTAGDKTDYAHQTLSLTGSIAGVIHVTQARKDDAGTRQIQQMCLSTGTEEDSATISLASTYQYFQDVLETDPHTSAAWTLSGFNAATFGVKEIT